MIDDAVFPFSMTEFVLTKQKLNSCAPRVAWMCSDVQFVCSSQTYKIFFKSRTIIRKVIRQFWL